MHSYLLSSGALGALVGFILALTGAGGAILAVPLLLFFEHLTVAEAAPVALLAVSLSAVLGAGLGLRAGVVRYRAAALIAATGALMSPLGLWLARRIPNEPLTLLFATVLCLVSFRMFKQATAKSQSTAQPLKMPAQPCQLSNKTGRFVWTAACSRALAYSGVTAGFLSGLLGVGGGFVIVPALKKATNAPINVIVATSLAVIALVSASGVVSTAIAGTMNWSIALPFGAGAMLAMVFGRRMATKLSGRLLQQAFAIVAGSIALGMALKLALMGH